MWSKRGSMQRRQVINQHAFLTATRTTPEKKPANLPPRADTHGEPGYPETPTAVETFNAPSRGRTFGGTKVRPPPWTRITACDRRAGKPLLPTEASAGVFAGPHRPPSHLPAYLEQAVAFANVTLWGTERQLIVQHASLRETARSRKPLEKAIADLRYGTVSSNTGPPSVRLVITPWGAFPRPSPNDIQSGTASCTTP